MLNRDISGGLRGGCIEGGKGEMEEEGKGNGRKKQ